MPKKIDRGMAADLIDAVLAGTKNWTRTKKQEERSPASRSYRYSRMTQERGPGFKEAAAEIMEKAYRKVSGPKGLPANARQIMYAARPHIQKVTGKELRSDYFTQVLLPDYLNETGVDWNVTYDARGHFNEPHGGRGFGVGTLEVRDYLAHLHGPRMIGADFNQAKVETLGPSGSFGAVLFVEKEGFDPLLRAAKIAERFDVAVMSTKGMSVTAARALVDAICHTHDIPLLILHDFDKAGFSIAGTLQRDTRRYEFQHNIATVDLGLSLDDVTAMALESEYQHHQKGNKTALIANLRQNGASDKEIAFMFADFDRLRSTRRVELNAMTSPQFIALVERKLRANGIAKVIPEDDLLEKTYRQYAIGQTVKTEFHKSRKAVEAKAKKALKLPHDLKHQVEQMLKQHGDVPWHQAIRFIIDQKSIPRPKDKGAGDEINDVLAENVSAADKAG
ncbi:MAG: hypothetical protein ABSF87_13660 [Xanthobacteraceae bacterium]|jgi:hypothetical protein